MNPIWIRELTLWALIAISILGAFVIDVTLGLAVTIFMVTWVSHILLRPHT